MLTYYNTQIEPGGDVKREDLATHVELTGIVFQLVLRRGEQVIGFLFECDWDLENGLGVRMDGENIEVGSQDSIT